jgi:hypothetical protein
MDEGWDKFLRLEGVGKWHTLNFDNFQKIQNEI